ncbi:MAG TPA: hypothetical protein PLD25_08660 [Chloroflexota bacterium]|nr:hypothetical protein [Chloroflexota bacterium]
MLPKQTRTILLLGLTAVFIGYLMVWLPGPGAGLSFLGIELGEWVKFMGVGLERNLFYLPPITLALMLVTLTLLGGNGRWQSWAIRGLALLISWQAFPAIEDITGPVRHEYMPRVQWIGLVLLAIVIATILCWAVKLETRQWLCWLLLVVFSLIGAVQPTRIYLQIQPNVAQLVGVSIGFGWGLILNGVGHLLVAGVSGWQLRQMVRQKRSAPAYPV